MCRKAGIYILTLVFVAAAVVIIAGNVSAGETVIEGKIQGASCVINETVCPENNKDPRQATERDFVLVTGDGNYYFMKNLKRFVKAAIINSDVRIIGEMRDKDIHVTRVDVVGGDGQGVDWNAAEIAMRHETPVDISDQHSFWSENIERRSLRMPRN